MTDGELIDALGGPRRVCQLLGYDPDGGGLQRVYNWRVRGIPSKVLLKHAAAWELARASIKSGNAASRKNPTPKTPRRPATA